MAINLTKDSIDLGIVCRNGPAMFGFYKDVLGLEHVADTPMPAPFKGTMHRLMCGTTLVKLVVPDNVPDAAAAPGGLAGATGFRYFTISVGDIDPIVEAAGTAGAKVPISRRTVREGVDIAMIEDPDGNWVELLQNT